MHKKHNHVVILLLVFITPFKVLGSDRTFIENCSSPMKLCRSDILSVTLNSIVVHPGTYDKGGNANSDLELQYALELGVLGHWRSAVMSWTDHDNPPDFPANLENDPYTVIINRKAVSMIKREILLYNSNENTSDLDEFLSQVNFVVRERRIMGSSTLCEVSLAKPSSHNFKAYDDFLNLIAKANESENRKANSLINLHCINSRKSAKITFKFLFEFERQPLP